LVFGDRSTGDFRIEADPADLADRRAAVAPHPWTWLHQVHGDEVVVVRHPGEHAGVDADASVTDVAGAVLAIQTADCAPVLLWSDAGVIGAAHAGWRGLYAGVVENVVVQMRELGATDVHAQVGPTIGPSAYEFGADDLTRMALRFGPEVVASTSDGRPALDLVAAIRSVFEVVGVELVGPPPACTATDAHYYSWRARRDTGRQCSVIWLEP
jgi:YfiH family protein